MAWGSESDSDIFSIELFGLISGDSSLCLHKRLYPLLPPKSSQIWLIVSVLTQGGGEKGGG
jgi:hypothetical protein